MTISSASPLVPIIGQYATKQIVKLKDETGNNKNFILGSLQLLPPDHQTLPRFNFMSRTILLEQNREQGAGSIWKAKIISPIDNSSTLEPSFNHPNSGYTYQSNRTVRIDSKTEEFLSNLAFNHHDQLKTAVVLDLAGSNTKEFYELFND